jgi:hypothetical protein
MDIRSFVMLNFISTEILIYPRVCWCSMSQKKGKRDRTWTRKRSSEEGARLDEGEDGASRRQMETLSVSSMVKKTKAVAGR